MVGFRPTSSLGVPMKFVCAVLLIAVSAAVWSSAQNKPTTQAFEVASVKPSNPSGGNGRGGGGVGFSGCPAGFTQITPDRLVMNNASVYQLITMAYGMG